jgi:hypothetical protein
MTKFLDNFIPDRIRLFYQDKDPNYVYELLAKNLYTDIDDLKKVYEVKIDAQRSRVFFSSDSMPAMSELLNLLESKDVNIESVTTNEIRVDSTSFINKVF